VVFASVAVFFFVLFKQPDTSTTQVSVILSADSATGEITPILNLMTNQKNESTTYCEHITSGELYNQKILAVTTGIGSFYVTVCVQEILLTYGVNIKEMYYCGVAGGSASIGGYLTDLGAMHQTEPVMVGDVCITSFARAYDDHWSSVQDWLTSGTPWTPGYGWMAFTNPKYGTGSVIADTSLVNDLVSASKSVIFPSMPLPIVNYSLSFHRSNEMRLPKVYDNSLCCENSGNDYWSGLPEDYLCRNFTAQVLATANTFPNATAENVLCITAMEAYGFIQTVQNWVKKNPGSNIQLAVLRGISDYTHPPVVQNLTDNKYYQIMPTYTWREIGYNFGGYPYAIQTTILPVIKLFQLRQPNAVA